MNDDKVNKALLDLVVKTANDLSKHHADLTLELLTEELESRLGEQGKSIKDLTDFVATHQNAFKAEIDELAEKFAETQSSLEGLVEAEHNTAANNFGVVHDEIKRVKNACAELAEIVDSNDNINALADAVKDLDTKLENDSNVTADEFENVTGDLDNVKSDISTIAKAHDSFVTSVDKNTNALADGLKELDVNRQNDAKLHKDLVESFINDVTKVNEALTHVTDDIAGNDEAQTERAGNLATEIKEAVDGITQVFENYENVHIEKMDTILADVAQFDERVNKLKTSLVGYGEDLAVVSADLHKKFDKLSESDEELDDALKQVHGLITAAEENNTGLRDDLEKVSTALSEQFSELKNESFLSADKIDTKFAEMRLALVETDVKRTEALNATVADLGDDLQKTIDEHLNEYHADIDKRITGETLSLVDTVNKTLAADKQLLARAKQWESGVEYGACVIVRNLGGVWQSRAATYDEPTAESVDWYCIASSFYKTSIIKQHLNGVETVIGIHDSLGNVHELSIPVPSIRYLKGVFDTTVTYDRLDSIMKDGCRWVATKDEPEGVPGEEDADWQVLTMRGPKGMKGATGERGPKGKTGEKGDKGEQGIPGPVPEMDSIVKAVVDHEADGDGFAIRRARGNWNIKNTYRAGDVVNVGRGLFVALKDNDGTQTPGSSTEDWLLLLEASGGSGNGGQVNLENVVEWGE